MKRIALILFFLLIVVDNQMYYYGIGFGFIAKKIPSYVKPKFSGSDTGNRGFYLTERESTIHVFSMAIPEKSIEGLNIVLSRINGYYFNDNKIILIVEDVYKKTYYVEILENSKVKFYGFESIDNDFEGYEYIDLNVNFYFFKILRVILFFTLILIIIVILRKRINSPARPRITHSRYR